MTISVVFEPLRGPVQVGDEEAQLMPLSYSVVHGIGGADMNVLPHATCVAVFGGALLAPPLSR